MLLVVFVPCPHRVLNQKCDVSEAPPFPPPLPWLRFKVDRAADRSAGCTRRKRRRGRERKNRVGKMVEEEEEEEEEAAKKRERRTNIPQSVDGWGRRSSGGKGLTKWARKLQRSGRNLVGSEFQALVNTILGL